MSKIILRIDQDLHWIGLDDQHPTHKDQGSWQEFAHFAQQQPVHTFIAARHIQLIKIKLPKLAHRHVQQAIEYEIETYLIDTAAHYHISWVKLSETDYLVAVVKLAMYQSILKNIRQFNIQLVNILPEQLALPHVEHHWQLLISESNFILRLSESQSYGGPHNYLKTLISSLDTISNKPTKLKQYLLNNAPNCAKTMTDIQIDTEHHNNISLLDFLGQAKCAPTLNLLPDKLSYQQRSKRLFNWVKSLSIAVPLIFILMFSYQTHHLKTQLKREATAAKKIYQQFFPTSTDIIAPEIRVRRLLKHTQAILQGSPMLRLLHISAPLVTSTQSLHIDSLSYSKSQLSYQLSTTNISAFENLEKTIASKQLNASLTHIATHGKTAQATLIVRETTS